MASWSMTLERAHWLVAALRVRVALARAQLALRGYNQFQPRVPAGVAEGGRWTADDGGGSGAERDDGRIRLAENETGRQKPIDLREEEMRGGHTLRKHVGKNDEELLAKVIGSRRISTFYRYGYHRDGSFASLGDANYL
ncbi:hypothetical protein [Methylobacterium soli]|uniref:Uncharacterized protein n=1 Tax=Methylobacterium soli TaxID=553447 RepID=A0A6L3T037_9HYPH|nr:hypothetical protein [Methylobacterium soli]KAB1077869.1 hypothetical protein F6X53_16790 [Methylobacterium soli]GJE42115.1 hypothetical protein AEGHOMDF_1286 [Methylobacterium soli]